MGEGYAFAMASLAKPNSGPNCGLTTRHNEKVRRFLVKETIQLELEFPTAAAAAVVTAGISERRLERWRDRCARSLSGTSISRDRKKKK